MSASMAEGMAAILAEHQYAFSTQIETDLKRACRKDTKWCTCGFEVTVYVDDLDRSECYDTSDRLRAKLAAHQAEQLAANGYGKLEEAKAEGMAIVANVVCGPLVELVNALASTAKTERGEG